MERHTHTRAIGTLCVLLPLLLAACGPQPQGPTGTEIIAADTAIARLSEPGTVLVDARGTLDYRKGHIEGAVNVPLPDITVSEPVLNMLAPPEKIAETFGGKGIGNDTTVLVYDDNLNMLAARVWWTLKVYGHDSVQVVGGGLNALVAAGAATTTEEPSVTSAVFTPDEPRTEMIATLRDVRNQVNEPDQQVVLVDTRTLDEFNQGTIPGSALVDFAENNFADGTFRPVRQIRIRYIEAGLDYDKEAILYCKTSVRGAQTYLALYNAGYRNLKLYDGAWVEWSANPMNPVFTPTPESTVIEASDAS
jgi:thiosulfate/3-mercaptopyruvate sulfurtransferase